MRPDRGFQRFARFLLWMLGHDDGGLTVSTQAIATHFLVTLDTAREWRREYFTARGVLPMGRQLPPSF
jgi:hypothetical protein